MKAPLNALSTTPRPAYIWLWPTTFYRSLRLDPLTTPSNTPPSPHRRFHSIHSVTRDNKKQSFIPGSSNRPVGPQKSSFRAVPGPRFQGRRGGTFGVAGTPMFAPRQHLMTSSPISQSSTPIPALSPDLHPPALSSSKHTGQTAQTLVPPQPSLNAIS